MRAILTYHSVDETGSVISIDERTFRRHVAWLAKGHVQVVPLSQLMSVPSDEDAIAITFDDGLASFGTVAAPLLLEHDLPATLFVVTDAVGSSNVWRGRQDRGIPVQPLLDWEQLGALQEAGIHLGAHTCTHPDVTTLRGDALEREIVASKQRLARELGVDATTFAYPYGAVHHASRDVVARTFRLGVHHTSRCTRSRRGSRVAAATRQLLSAVPRLARGMGIEKVPYAVGVACGSALGSWTLTRSLAR